MRSEAPGGIIAVVAFDFVDDVEALTENKHSRNRTIVPVAASIEEPFFAEYQLQSRGIGECSSRTGIDHCPYAAPDEDIACHPGIDSRYRLTNRWRLSAMVQ
ncbi:MAG: hypothetical protein WKG52_05640 [Variovorax sp.]